MKALFIVLALLAANSQAATLVDLAGRQVTIPAKVERIVLGEGRMLTSLTILDRDLPSKRIVGMLGDFEQLDPGAYAQYLQVYPRLDQIARLGKSSASFSVEETIRLKPDLAVFSLRGHGPGVNDVATLRKLQSAGVTVVYVDFTQDPLKNTPQSIRVLGRMLGKEKAAEQYIDFYQQEMARVSTGLSKVKRYPSVFLESRVGLDKSCCETITHAMLGRFVDAAGGNNIAKTKVPGAHGVVNVEFLLTEQPEFYIATAIGNPQSAQSNSPRIALGAGITPAMAQKTLRKAMQRTGIAELDAVRNGKTYALSHQFNYSAANVVAVQAIAKWLHPEQFAQLDPNDTLQRFYQRFQPVALNGTYWAALQ